MNDHINWLEVKNMGAFENLHVDFNPSINIIIGGNGVGKTSILRMLTLCMTAQHLNETRRRTGASVRMEYEYNEAIGHIGADFKIERPTEYMQYSDYNIDPAANVDNNVDNFLTFNDKCQYKMLAIGAHRYFSYKPIDGMKKENPSQVQMKDYRNSNPAYLDHPELPAIKQWMINRYFVLEKEWAECQKKNWNFLKKKLPMLAPSGRFFKFLTIKEDLEPMFSVDDRECYLEELSSGFKAILSIIFTIVDWIEGVNDGDNRFLQKAMGTVLIDEVDVHLHPEWQAKIMSILREFFPNLQFIVTTHSPYVIANANPNEIIRIDRLSDNMNLEPINKSFAGWQIQDIVYDLMGMPRTNNKLLTPVLKRINNAYKARNVEDFDSSLEELRTMVSPSDIIVKQYEIKRGEMFLDND